MDISNVDNRVTRVLDIKTPGSGEVKKNRWSNLKHLSPRDELKFVLCDEADYLWAVQIMNENGLDKICPILFSPVYGQLDPTTLADWILRDHLSVRLQVQLHKLLWGEGPGR
jgi:7-carboxy-7-deazaguanine synthase